MSYLIDTNAWIGFFEGRSDFSQTSKTIMTEEPDACSISIASIWEASIKVGIGKLKLPYDLHTQLPKIISDCGFLLLPVEFNDAVATAKLPKHHGEPFDRIMAVQASRRKLRIISRDPIFERYGLRRVW